jgi:MFS superfamily sulfate permease-like transporter
MKLYSTIQSQPRRTTLSAFTLVEMMFSVGIYVGLFVAVMIAIQIFGLRVYTLAATKLTSTADARKALNQIRDDIRQAKMLQIGNLGTAGDATTFSAFSGTNFAQGAALQVFATTNQGAPYNIYYLDTIMSPTNYLKTYMVDSNNVITSNTLVGYITNSLIFAAEDYRGNVLTNSLKKNNQVYSLTLQFFQWEYPIAYVGAGNGFNEYNYYQVRTKAARRALD